MLAQCLTPALNSSISRWSHARRTRTTLSAYTSSVTNSIELHAFPRIGSRPVSEATSADMLEVLTPIWHVKVQTARNVRQRISAVMEWAIAMNLRSDNPYARVLPVLGKQNEAVRHMWALPHRDVAAADGRLAGYRSGLNRRRPPITEPAEQGLASIQHREEREGARGTQ